MCAFAQNTKQTESGLARDKKKHSQISKNTVKRTTNTTLNEQKKWITIILNELIDAAKIKREIDKRMRK